MKYVYRKSDDVPARPNANRNQVRLGLMTSPVEMCPAWGCGGPSAPQRLLTSASPQPAPVTPVGPVAYPIFRGPVFWGSPGATNMVPQVPPGQMPGYTTPNYSPLPLSPAPSPTVAVPASQTAPSLTSPGTTLSSAGNSPGAWLPNTAYAVGQAVVDPAGHTQQVLVAGTSGPSAPNFNDLGGNTTDGSVVWNDTGIGGAAASSGIGSWLAQSNLISGVPNWGIAAAAVLLVMTMSKRR